MLCVAAMVKQARPRRPRRGARDRRTNRPHDSLFKAAFGRPAQARGLLRAILSARVTERIEWSSLRRERGTFIDADLSDRFSDLLFAARLRDGAPVLVYVLVEHQATVDPDMPLRVLGYMTRIWERDRERRAIGPRPLIVPTVLSHAPGGWTEPVAFEALFAPAPADLGIAELVPRFEIRVLDLAHLSNAEIKAMSLAGFQKLALWLLRDARDAARLRASFPAWAALLREAHAVAVATPHGMAAFARLLHYLWHVAGDLRFDEFRGKLLAYVPAAKETVMTIAEELKLMGRQEGRQEGLVEALRKLLAVKFGALDEALAARIAAATPEQVDRYLERILTADSPADVLRE